MLNFNSILLFSETPEKLKDFYAKVFAKEPEWVDQGYYGWMVKSAFFMVGPHKDVSGPNKDPNRVLFNFETEDVKGEFERIKSLEATVVKEPYNPGEEPSMQIATFADPDGNLFQLVSPFKGK